MSRLPSFPSFDITDQVSLGPSWGKWLYRIENFLTALNITNDARKKRFYCTVVYACEGVFDVYDTLSLRADTDNFGKAKEKLSNQLR